MAALKEQLSRKELLGWVDYFERRPVGWREDQRTAMLVNAFGAKTEPEDLFPSLRAVKEGSKRQTSAAQQFVQRFGHLFPELTLEE